MPSRSRGTEGGTLKILVAYDGSDGARRVLRGTAPLARAADATVILLRVLDPRVDAAAARDEAHVAALMVVAERRAEEELVDAATGLAPQTRTRVEVVRRGEDVGETIVRVAREEAADIIAIATRRAAGVTGMLLGSVTQQVIRGAPCPLLVIRTD